MQSKGWRQFGERFKRLSRDVRWVGLVLRWWWSFISNGVCVLMSSDLVNRTWLVVGQVSRQPETLRVEPEVGRPQSNDRRQR